MKVLWITNIVFPEAQALLTGKPAPHSGSGGWLMSSAEGIMHKSDVKLVVAGCLYRSDDVMSLAFQICETFKNSKDFDNSIMIETAKERHDVFKNTNQLLTIYKDILC